MEVDSAPVQQGAANAAVGAQLASAGIKREASDILLVDQQPAKVAKIHTESQTAHSLGQAGAHHGTPLANEKSPQGAEPSMEPQTAHPLSHTGEQSPSVPAQQIPVEQMAVDSERRMLEQQAARRSPEADAASEAILSMPSDVNTPPIKLEWGAVPRVLPNDPATPAVAPAAEAAGWVVPKSESPQETSAVKPSAGWNATILGDSLTSHSAPRQPQDTFNGDPFMAEFKTEAQHLAVAEELWHMDNVQTSTWHQPAVTRVVKEGPDAVLLPQRNKAQRAVHIKLEAVDQAGEQQGLHETALATGLGGAALASECTARAEGRVWQPQGPAGQVTAAGIKVLNAGDALPHVKLQASPPASGSSPRTAPASISVVPGLTEQDSSSAAPTAVLTIQAVAPAWTLVAPLIVRASAPLGPAAEVPTATLPVSIKHEPMNTLTSQRTATDCVTPPCSPSSFDGRYLSDLLAKRRQELLAEAAVKSSKQHT